MDSRVPRWRVTSDHTPYATSGSSAAKARTSAKRVAMWRIFTSVSAGHLSDVARAPQPERREDVSSRFDPNVEACAHRARALAPRQKDGGWIIDDRTLKLRNAGFVFVVLPGFFNSVQ